MFYFVIFNGTVLSSELGTSYSDVEKKLEGKLKEMIDQNNSTNLNQELLVMDLIIGMLKLNQDQRPSTQ